MCRFEKFAETVSELMKSKIEGILEIRRMDVAKDNGVTYRALQAIMDNLKSAPLVPLEPLYQSYEEGLPMDSIISQIKETLQNTCEISGSLFRELGKFDVIAPNIMYKIINAEWNRKQLAEMPHCCFLNLAAVFYVLLGEENDYQVSAGITNEIARKWNVTAETLWKVARVNTIRVYPAKIESLDEVLKPFLEQVGADGLVTEDFWKDEERVRLYVLINQMKTLGAGCIFYPQVLEKFAASMGKDLVILPSSIHETLLLARTADTDLQSIEKMVREVNRDVVAQEEWLSDQAYGYSLKEHRLMMLSELLSADAEEESVSMDAVPIGA